MIYYLAVIHLENIVAYISCISLGISIVNSLSTYIHNSVLKPLCLDLPFSSHMHWNAYCVPTFSIYHVFISILKFFCCLLLLGNIFTLNLQQYKIFNHSYLYSIFEHISMFRVFRLWTHVDPTCDTNNKGRCFYLSYIRPI